MHGPAEMQSPVISDQLSVSKKIKPELLSEIGLEASGEVSRLLESSES